MKIYVDLNCLENVMKMKNWNDIDLSEKERDQVPEVWKLLWRPRRKTRGTSMERMTRPRTAMMRPLHRRFAGTPYDDWTAPKPPLFIVAFFNLFLSLSLFYHSLFLLVCVLCFFCFLFFFFVWLEIIKIFNNWFLK